MSKCKTDTDCKINQICTDKTNRCVSKDGKTGKDELTRRSKKKEIIETKVVKKQKKILEISISDINNILRPINITNTDEDNIYEMFLNYSE